MDKHGHRQSLDQQQTRTTSTPIPQSNAAPSRESFLVTAPSISLPKGGGAIRGMGEKFAANPVTGTGSMTVPIAASPGRSSFGPQLSLAYDSGAGNGPFGLGWNLSLPSITRRTDKGLPKYQDADDSDVFVLSGAEDLVPVLVQDSAGQWVPEVLPTRIVGGTTYQIRRYRPRIEGLFARIERWTNQTDSEEIFWRSITKDSITTWYGRTSHSRIADPDDPSRVFSWLICESYDDKGNVIGYQYKEENSDSIDGSQVHERNRTSTTRISNRYLKHIRYGNHDPYFPELKADHPWPTVAASDKWYFEVVFDYGEHDAAIPTPAGEIVPWPRRNDPFSTYRATFEVRTYRLCQRVLMFHHFPMETDVGVNCLVRSTDFTYSYEEHPADARNPIFSTLRSVSQTSYKRQGNGYLKKSLPPVEFQYTEPNVDGTIHDVDPASLENLPGGLDGGNYQWIDLDGEGLSGILTEQAQGWFYKRNLSPVNWVIQNGVVRAKAKFAPVELVATKPNTTIAGGHGQFMDLAGDGQPDLVMFDSPTPGFYEHGEGTSWKTFRPFTRRLNRSLTDPNVKLVDLDGDGHADVLVTEDEAFTWHLAFGEEGFGPAQRVAWGDDEERGPALVFADGTQSIYLADLSGDGLTDLVRIRNGDVCYWPNLGYGRFGAKVTMDHAPWFDSPELFDQRRVHLADIDGSGVTDILYLHGDGVRLYFNQSGNSWSQPTSLPAFPRSDSLSAVTVVDLLGNGTACLVWSSPLPGSIQKPMRYIDLMGGQKPHLLIRTTNNLGAETLVRYRASTKFYLQDKRDEKPWITRLPFPVHVVERVETLDRISRNRFVTRYAYHHGYFDGEEREFRGFGMVEQFDTEELGALTDSGEFPDATNIDAASYVPTVLTKTWFHTGAYLDEDRISRQFEEDYYREGDTSGGVSGLTDQQLEAMLLPDTEWPTTVKRTDGSSISWQLTTDELREASRALKGAVLRQEIYALDGTDKEDRPYSATEQNYTIELLQPRAGNRYAVLLSHARESISFHYERRLVGVAGQQLADPRVAHTMTLEVDGFGNVLKSVAVGYGRRPGLSSLQGDDKLMQEQIHVTATENEVTNAIEEDDAYRTPLPVQARTYELLKVRPDSNEPVVTNLFRFGELLTKVNQAGDGLHDLAYEDVTGTGASGNHPYRRLIEHVRTQYRPDDLGASLNDPLRLLPLGRVESLALPGESYKLAFTPGLLAQAYHRNGQPLLPNPSVVLGGQDGDQGGYVDLDGDGHWWIPSGRIFLSPGTGDTAVQELGHARRHFFLPPRYRDPFGVESLVTYDAHDLLMVASRDALDNRVLIMNDYRLLTPKLITDPNGNRAEVAFDTLGLVVGTVVMGKVTETLGDLLDASFEPDVTQSQLDALIAEPREPSADPNESVATQIVHDLLAKATTRIVYDVDRFRRIGEPPYAATIARETHVSDLQPGQRTKIRVSFSYSDGFGREIQKKVQAEPGPVPQRDANGRIVVGADEQPVMTANSVSPRWVGSGWTIFNNKGKPIRQYEPFFTDRHTHEFEVRTGVSPVLFYDPVERVVATLHPNHTWEKVVFDPWQQESWDVNDTVLLDPKQDVDVSSFFLRLPDDEYLPTWHGQRIGGGLGLQEQKAANQAAAHAATPAIAHADSLGRTVLTIAHNKVVCAGHPLDGTEAQLATRVVFDIEGNQLAVRDAVVQSGDQLGRIVMTYDYDVAGNRIHQASMEAGERWMLSDVTGMPIRAFDSRGHNFTNGHDRLRRPLTQSVRGTDSVQSDPRTLGTDILFGQIEYGEGQASDVTLNLRTRPFRSFDGAGVVTNVGPNPITNKEEGFDFKGNLRRSTRQLTADYRAIPNWLTNPALQDSFTSSTTYDALNRPISAIAPDKSVYRPIFNEANLLDKVEVHLRGAVDATSFVADIDYDARGQRELIRYGNGTETRYTYDPLTLRLVNLRTTRESDNVMMQDLSYTYDPAGNITHIKEEAHQTIYFNGGITVPENHYIYDALYRLIEGTGREHIGQVSPPETTWNDEFRVKLAHPQDGNQMRSYVERYEYDPVGNFIQMIHQATNGNWTRSYRYNESSLIESPKTSNRLSSSAVGSVNPSTETYHYDAHGNMLTMAHLQLMNWDFKDQLRHVDLGGGGEAFYVYDAGGQRARKVVEKNGGSLIEERIYLGGFEIFRRRNGAGTVTLERDTLHVMDDNQRIALVETRTQGDDGSPMQLVRYQFGNHLGSASLELDAAGQIISYEEYFPYGSTAYQAVRSGVEASPKRYRYTGMERDEETGLSYHRERYYIPWLAMWLSCDPKGLVDGTCLYCYVRNSPVIAKDPTGLETEIAGFGRKIGITPRDVREIADWFAMIRERLGLSPSPMLSNFETVYKPDRDIDDWFAAIRKQLGLPPASPPPPPKPYGGNRIGFKPNAPTPSPNSQGSTPVKTGIGFTREPLGPPPPNPFASPEPKYLKSPPPIGPGRAPITPPSSSSTSPPAGEGAAGGEGGAGKGRGGGGGAGVIGTVIALGVAAFTSNSTKEFLGNSAVNLLATRVPTLAAVTAEDEGSALTAIVVAKYVAPPLIKHVAVPVLAHPATWVVAGGVGVGYLLFMDKGHFQFNPKLAERKPNENKNPFCNQCHGQGGLLHPEKKLDSFEPFFEPSAPTGPESLMHMKVRNYFSGTAK